MLDGVKQLPVLVAQPLCSAPMWLMLHDQSMIASAQCMS